MISARCFLLCLVVAAVSARRPCAEERQAALERLQQNQHILGLTIPKCDADGTYSPKQCIEAYCNCVDKDGEVIDNTRFHVGNSAESECKCAREKDFIRNSHLIGKMIACDEVGNYKRSQCLGSVCFCVDPKEGNHYGDGVHITEQGKLNC